MIRASSAESPLPHPERLRARALELLTGWGAGHRAQRVRVLWNSRLSTAAGRADLAHARISLNPRLLARVPHEIEKVLVHEAAHLAVHWLFSACAEPHGDEWRALMQRAGHEPSACHAYPIEGLRRRAFWYLHLCVRCESRAIVRKAMRMSCRRCGTGAEILRLRAPRDEQGYAALRRMGVAEARTRAGE